MASTSAPARAENDRARKGESNGGGNSVLQAGGGASGGATPDSGKSIAESPPPARRLSFSGMFRSASRESNQQMSPIANKLFSRDKRSKSRAFSLSRAAPPPAAPLQGARGPGRAGAFRLETYASEPRRLRSFSSPPDAAQAWSPSACALAGPAPLAPPLPLGGRDSLAAGRAADFGSAPE